MLRYQACGLSLHRYLGPTCGPSGRSQDRAAAPARWSGNVVVAQGTNGPGRPAHPLSRNAGGGSRTAAAVVGAAGPMVDRELRLAGLRVAGGGAADLGKVGPGGVGAGGPVGWQDTGGRHRWHSWHGWHGIGEGHGTVEWHENGQGSRAGRFHRQGSWAGQCYHQGAKPAGSWMRHGHGTEGVAWERPKRWAGRLHRQNAGPGGSTAKALGRAVPPLR